ncbi:MAG: hypothetical protein P8Q45_01375 [Candidatus Thalassarchaeaceae archaeon]|jgi:hypothetical protein|nr:hypothetical protein [Candidatus Thalassarchaeaceae archaeon]
MGRSPRLLVALILIGLLALPAIANSQGPPQFNAEDDETAKYGCTCHGNAAPGDRAVVMISGVPVMYDAGADYEMIITVADSVTLAGSDGNTKAGFLLTANGIGGFSWDSAEEIREAEDNPDAISHDQTGSGVWTFTWTAPSSDTGTVHFSLVGNSVDSSGLPDEGDYWNILTFSINAPGTISDGDNDAVLQTRTIAVGDYDTLFVLEESEAEKEAERQKHLSETIFEKGNLFYWTSLTALLVGAVYQREIMERRYETGPEYLAMELAYPQGIRRGLVAILAFYLAVDWTANAGQGDFIIGCAWFIAAWASYGVYRTVRSAQAEPTVHDVM